MNRVLLASVAALLVVAPSAKSVAAAPASDLAIDVGGIPLELGMPQDEVFSRLVNVYDLRHEDSIPGTWTVTRKGGPPYDLLGSLAFRERKLAFVSRIWESPDDRTANGLALAVHRALKSLSAGQARACTVSTGVTGVVVSATLRCGRRRFSILGSSDGSTGASVNETVSIDR